MRITFTPQPHQVKIYTWLQKMKRSAVFASMGSGKTISTLTALMDLSLSEDIYPVLIIAPLRVAKSTWPDEIEKWEHTEHLTFSCITGSKKERETALSVKADIYTINYENIPWLVDRLSTNWIFRTVVIDESTKLKGFRLRQGSSRAKALAKVAQTLVNRIILLTGTPTPNGLKDLWGQLWFIDKGERLGKSYSHFTNTWFDEDYSGYNLIPKKNAQQDIQNCIADVCLTVDIADYLPLNAPIINKILISMPDNAQKLYKKMEKDFFIELESEGVEAPNTISMLGKCAQIANGTLYREDKTWETIHDVKLEALDSVIEEANGMPVLVVYKFRSDLARLGKYFPQGEILNDHENQIKKWNAGNIPILFIHPQSAGHGLNLQYGSNILAFFSVDWSLEEHLQVIERIGPARQKQAGLNRPVFLHYILAKGTIDEEIMDRLSTKKSVQDILLAAMNKRKEDKNGR